MDVAAGTAMKKKNPSRYSKFGSSRQRIQDQSGDVAGTELEQKAKDYINEKEGYEDFVTEFYDINKMTLDGTNNLMNFLANPEADEELQSIENHELTETN